MGRTSLLYIVSFLLLFSPALRAQEKGVFRGCDGGMMIHTGYISCDIPSLGYRASGAPIGVGGVARAHLGSHWRVGGEGYVSKLGQMHNGSYIRYGWGGLLADFCWEFGKWMPYAGLTLGGGRITHYLMFEEADTEWGQVKNAVYHSSPFFAVDPYLGCDYAVSKVFRLTLKIDFLNGIGKNLNMPRGPRFYLGFLFYH